MTLQSVRSPSHVDISGRAASIRALCGQEEPPYSTRQLIEVALPDVLVTGRPLPDGIDEMVSITPDGPVILYSRRISTPHQRVAIAHAVAHLLFDLEHAELGCRPGSAGDAEIEARADLFAAELLVPLEELAPYVRTTEQPHDLASSFDWLDMVDELASHFQVPRWLVRQQIGSL